MKRTRHSQSRKCVPAVARQVRRAEPQRSATSGGAKKEMRREARRPPPSVTGAVAAGGPGAAPPTRRQGGGGGDGVRSPGARLGAPRGGGGAPRPFVPP